MCKCESTSCQRVNKGFGASLMPVQVLWHSLLSSGNMALRRAAQPSFKWDLTRRPSPCLGRDHILNSRSADARGWAPGLSPWTIFGTSQPLIASSTVFNWTLFSSSCWRPPASGSGRVALGAVRRRRRARLAGRGTDDAALEGPGGGTTEAVAEVCRRMVWPIPDTLHATGRQAMQQDGPLPDWPRGSGCHAPELRRGPELGDAAAHCGAPRGGGGRPRRSRGTAWGHPSEGADGARGGRNQVF